MLITSKDLNIEYKNNFFSKAESRFFLDTFINNIKWRRDVIKIYGKSHLLPRLTAFFGDSGKTYSYSGIKMNPLPWTKEILAIKSKVEDFSGKSYNSVLLNRYRDGLDYQGYHSDDEASLGTSINIASVSFGSVRDFSLKRKDKGSKTAITFPLGSGSVLIMRKPTQKNWLHSIPKRLKVDNERVNLTFRYII